MSEQAFAGVGDVGHSDPQMQGAARVLPATSETDADAPAALPPATHPVFTSRAPHIALEPRLSGRGYSSLDVALGVDQGHALIYMNGHNKGHPVRFNTLGELLSPPTPYSVSAEG